MINGLSSFSVEAVLGGIRKKLYDERLDQKAGIEKNFEAERQVLQVEQKRWETLENSTREANGAVKLALDTVTKIRDELIKMSRAIINLEGGGDTATNRTNFDLALKRMAYLAERARVGHDLTGSAGLGDYSGNSVSYTGYNGRETTLDGRFIGTEFKVEDAVNGTVWVSDMDSGKLIEYTDLESKAATGREGYLGADIRFDSEIGDQLSFTYKPDAENAAISGTVTKGGLDVGSSWSYADLETAEGRAAAKEAIMQALRTLRSAETQYKAQQSVVDSDLSRIRAKIKESLDAQGEVNTRENLAVAVMDAEYRERYAGIEKGMRAQASNGSQLQAMMNKQVAANSPLKVDAPSPLKNKGAEGLFGKISLFV